MKKLIILFFSFLFICSYSLFAQVAEIIEVKGSVFIRQEKDSSWKKAEVEAFLDKGSSVKTDKSSECAISFDDALENVMTIKENSQVSIESLLPVNVSLPQGKVFALIDNLHKVKDFQVRTPTAVSGVRGTGESVESGKDGSKFKCFKGKIYVKGTGGQGGKKGLRQGWGVHSGKGGEFSPLFKLGGLDYSGWHKFLEDVNNQREHRGKEPGLKHKGSSGFLKDLKQDNKDSYRDDKFKDLRKEKESVGRSGGKSVTSGN